MLSSVLDRERAIRVNIAIMRAFVQLREMIGSNKGLARRLNGALRLYSHGPSVVFGETRRSMSSFAKASEDTRYAILHGITALASCVGG